MIRNLRLTYRDNRLKGFVFNSQLPVFKIGDFDAAPLEGGRWRFTPLTDFRSAESARASLEPLIRNVETEWDVMVQLRLSFEFESCDLELGPGATITLSTRQTSRGAEYILARPAPSPPSGKLHYTPWTGQLRARWHEMEDGRERLLVGCNWILTALENEFGGLQRGKVREVAAHTLNVEPKVLNMLGQLCERNDPAEGRKNRGPVQPLTSEEGAWVHQAVSKLVRRAVEIKSGLSQLPTIKMKDLPRL
jgi:hypothetical protein